MPSLSGPWLGTQRGYLSDWVTQRWVQLTGRRFDAEAMPWLDGPSGATSGIGADFYERLAASRGLELQERAGQGLTESFAELAGPEFDPQAVDPRIVEFYESTSDFHLDAWSHWCAAFWPFGWLLSTIFSRRLQQLNIPLSPLDTSRGFNSRVIALVEPGSGARRHTGWVRELPSTQEVVYVGDYSVARVPGLSNPCVKVVFPLPNGNATVLLRPEVLADGSLLLHSSGARFGDPGFYFVVQHGGKGWARYVRTMRELLRVYLVDGELHTEHTFRIWGIKYLRLHYRLQLKQALAEPPRELASQETSEQARGTDTPPADARAAAS